MFLDREDAARLLAERLSAYRGRPDAVILAIPRGGVAIGAVLAERLGLPLDIVLTKKIGHPSNPEFAVGVVNLSGEIIDEEIVARDRIPREYLEKEIARLHAELQRRRRAYHAGRQELSLRAKTAIVCDDGIATGHTMIAALRMARREGAAKVVAAAPVGAPDSVEAVRREADETACVLEPSDFFAIGQFYRRFEQVEDEDAARLLREAR